MDERPPADGLPPFGEAPVPAVPPAPAAPQAWVARHRLLAGMAAGAGLALAAAGVALVLVLQPNTAIDRMAPASADVYVTAYLEPSIPQKLNLLGVAHRFPDFKTDADITNRVNDWLDRALRQSGITFSGDVRPWLGSRASLVLRTTTNAPSALLVASRDDGRAGATLAKLRSGPEGQKDTWRDEIYQGIAIAVGTPASGGTQEPAVYALVDHTVVIGNAESLLKDIIDADRGTAHRLIDSAGYVAMLRHLPQDRLLLGYFNGASAVPELKHLLSGERITLIGASAARIDQLDALRSAGFTLVARSNGIAADTEILYDRGKLDAVSRSSLDAAHDITGLSDFVPRQAYGFVATSTLQATLQPLVDEVVKSSAETGRQLDEYGVTGHDGVLAHLTGDAVLEAGPGRASQPAGAVLVGTTDMSAMDRFMKKVIDLLSHTSGRGGLVIQGTSYRGQVITSIADPSLVREGVTPSYAVEKGFLMLASSVEELKAVMDAADTGPSITSAENFRAVRGAALSGASSMLYVDLSKAFSAVRALLPSAERFDYDVKTAPRLAPVKAVLISGRSTQDVLSELLVLLIPGAPAGGSGASQA